MNRMISFCMSMVCIGSFSGAKIENKVITSMKKQGLLVAFEGIDGSGKTTLIRLVDFLLRGIGHQVIITSQPGGTVFGKELRSLIMKQDLSGLTDFFLFSADRAQHVETLIKPALERGDIVLTDRYTLSSCAYQGYGRGVPLDFIAQVNAYATGGITPDIVVYLKVPLDCASGRRMVRKDNDGAADRFDSEKERFFKKVCDGYDDMVKQDPTILVVDGTQEPQDCARIVVLEIGKKLCTR